MALLVLPESIMRIRIYAPHRFRSALWQRVAAWCALALVLLLNILAASPQAHAWIHGREFVYQLCNHDRENGVNGVASGSEQDHDDEEAGCVITQFAQGHFAHELAALFLVPDGFLCWEACREYHAQDFPATEFKYPFGCGPPVI